MTRLRALSGIKPTGSPHWGNYFGMIQPAVQLSKDYESFYFIADFHALTTVRDAAALREDSYGVAATLIAAGLDPADCVLWRQSDVPEVCELSWLLGCVSGFGLIERAHAFKDARANERDVNFGVVSYPVLMAADILLYDADVVPVGKDQVQHLEMTRDMAQSFNATYGEVFKLPVFQLGTPEPVPGIDGRKMSKSYDNTIPIMAKGKALKKLVMSIKTDSTPLEDPKDPDTCSVFAFYALFADAEQQAAMRANYAGGNYGYGHAKLALIEAIDATFGHARERRAYYDAHPDEVEDILRAGAEKARKVARGVLDRARAACGLV